MRVRVLLAMPAEVGDAVEFDGERVGLVVGCENHEKGVWAVTLEVTEQVGQKMLAETPFCSVGTKENGGSDG